MAERLKALDELGEEFARIARTAEARQPRGSSRQRMVVVLVVLSVLALAAVAVAASGVLSGSPIKNPPGVKISPTRGEGTVTGSALLPLRVADPAGGLPWGLRLVHTTRGYACLQLGRVNGHQIGVLGQDGAFANDGRFHELDPGVLTSIWCVQPDAAGQPFFSSDINGAPASGSGVGIPTGCIVRRIPTNIAKHIKTQIPPQCASGDVRIVHLGLLGPEVKSVTYLGRRGQIVTSAVAAPLGAYLIVERPRPGRHVDGQFTSFLTPAFGLKTVRYRDGTVCHIVSASRLGGAKPCPLVGYVFDHTRHLTSHDVASPVHARFAPYPTRPHGVASPQWKLTVTYRSRVRGDARAYNTLSIWSTHPSRCQYNASGPVGHDVRAGDIVTKTFYVPLHCHGTLHGVVGFHQPHGQPITPGPVLPYGPGGQPAIHDPVVGRFTVRVP